MFDIGIKYWSWIFRLLTTTGGGCAPVRHTYLSAVGTEGCLASGAIQILADLLTQFQPGEADYAHNITTPPGF